ncbi:hemerythrin domain-containing protein [Ideonella oryzae]|uniref:Hemerythrin domain-containing protein n=1 Tax=Ideonella oryzae TaxID=2937441 RepID=A0ABT1BJS2_9BURK|nr:hemerythrin domain-containing protein [Ideonella oryzae]MCO5976457.1 hemerythrin domain-containing protein [Ideonella oryzae]
MQDTSLAHQHTNAARTSPAATAPRYDLYQGIHKALRRLYADTLVRLGQADPDDSQAMAQVLGQVRTLCDICEVHYADEDRFMHPALEQAQPGCTAAITAEHEVHRDTLESVRELTAVVEASHGTTRSQALNRLYQTLAVLMAEDLIHMRVEDQDFNAVLWRHYDDAALQALEGELVATIPPAIMMATLPWMIGALNAPERSAFLAGARQGMPPAVFEAVITIARRELPEGEWNKLAAALYLPPN